MKRLFIYLVLALSFVGITKAQTIEKKRPKIGVVLSGGGAKGLAHIGVLKVLEQAGIPVDYIGGTSMGSIIGGLYAIGYTADQLDSIVRAVDWDELLTDKVSRRNLSMMEKDENVKYMISFPIREKRISLPSSIVSGQNISTTFNDLCSPVYNVNDFSKFHIPFLCIASDIENGQTVVLKSGSLPDAMRASMAIPTVFTPEKLNGMPLMDGGMVNNFPVSEVREMGADIIIGVDVGFNYNKRMDNLSLVQIIEQSIFMHSKEQNLKHRESCDILIAPKMDGLNMTSFNQTDSLIGRGEFAALNLKDKIDLLAGMLRDSFGYVKPRVKDEIVKITKYNIQSIEVEGLQNIPQNFIVRKLPFKIPGIVKTSEIEKFIQVIYGTWFFERISYAIETSDNGVKLVFKVQEKNTNYFRAGLHYDNDFKTTLVLNTTFRNMISKGSKISLDLALGENPSFSALYYKNSGWNPKYNLLFWSKFIPDYGLHFQTHNFEVYAYDNDIKTASLGFTDITTEFFLQGNLSNNSIFGLGVMSDFITVSSRISTTKVYDQDSYFLNIKGYYKTDSYDEAFFPATGKKMSIEIKYVKGLSDDVKLQDGFFQGHIRANFIQPLSRRISVSESLFAGTTLKDTLSSPYWFYFGGLATNNLRGLMPFVGLDFMQRAGNHLLIGRLDVQWEMWKDNFLTVKSNVGKATRVRKNLLVAEDIIAGYGISYGYRSPIGPIELTLASSNKNKGVSVFVSIGYWF